jgi:hypothetical protein
MRELPMETSHMMRTLVTSERLRKLVSKQHSDKQDFHGNQQTQQELLCGY